MVQVNEHISVRPYTRRDLTPMRHLTFYNFRVHTHLDWQTTYDYLHSSPERLWLALVDNTVVGAIAFSEPLGGYAWVRLLAVADNMDIAAVVRALWGMAAKPLRDEGTQQVMILLTRDWVHDWAAAFGFAYVEDIVSLRYHNTIGQPPPPSASLKVHSAELLRVPDIYRIDGLAFKDPWRMTQRDVRLGIRISTYATVALDAGDVIAYQIATTHGVSGHLARLGVAPAYQGRGIGGGLLHDMMHHFDQRGVQTITVNTQASNVRSQQLYERFGFVRNGYDLPVWSLAL